MKETPISSSLLARLADATRYVVSGVTPATWFGPMQPLKPQAPDDVAGRRFDYPVGYNLNAAARSNEPVTFDDLRALADSCDILRSVIETRKDQMEAQEWAVRVIPSRHAGAEQQRAVAEVTEFLSYPDGEHSFAQWMRQILEDLFVIDAVALYKRRNRAGKLAAMEVVDGASIRLLLDEHGRTPQAPSPAYQQILKGVPAVDYTREELLYLKHNPRSHKVYGYSHVEQVLVTVNILIRRALHQLEYFREGSQPDALIGLPKDWTQDQIATFQRQFDALLAGNSATRRHVRFMPGEFKYQETKAPPLKDAYDEYLARIICFVFSVSPEPFVGQVNRATAQSAQERAIAEGLAPLQKTVRGLMNRIIQRELGYADLEFVWQDTREQDPKEAAQIDVAYVNAGIIAPDEVRQRMGLAALHGGTKPAAKMAQKYNPHHVPAGNPDGGQFTTPEGAGGVDNDSVDSDFVTGAISGAIGLVGAAAVGVMSEIGAAETAISGAEVEGAVESEALSEAEAGNAVRDAEWKLGEYKSPTRWQNQMKERGWTEEEITNTIKEGEAFPADNKINKLNPAIRYVNTETGKSLVMDEVTREIIQIGKEGFKWDK